MNYFTIHTAEQDEHIGFLVMLADDGGQYDAPHGQFAIKLIDTPYANTLTQWANQTELRWAIEQGGVQLYDEHGSPIGRIIQQHLHIAGKNFIINDLIGVM